ncbi:hypothetical protein Shell_0196 [Staphylothermus hellenicus DSM 12710]|uniref:Uncharacterized protein n=2 Tax=Staphylothermus hellenicus TaxID=84599 RepID=D7DAZ1_STAHD|nr:hypothetical protein Shell_0196 [Staphylothermus hellenicus DSM 12710]
MVTVRLIGLFLFYSYVKGYPIKFFGEVKDRVLRDAYKAGLLTARVLAIRDVIETLKRIPLELIYETSYEDRIDIVARGRIDFPKTIALYGSGRLLIVSSINKRLYDSPETLLLANIALEIKEIIEDLEENVSAENYLLNKIIGLILDDLRETYSSVSWITELAGIVEREDYDSLLQLCDTVLERGNYGYYFLAKSFKQYLQTIMNIGEEIAVHGKPEHTGSIVGVELERIFEIYTHYLTTYALLSKLERIGVKEIIVDHKGEFIEINVEENGENISYRIYHSKGFSDKSWLTRNKQVIGGPEAGRPDITITINKGDGEEIVFVMDAKQRRSLEDIYRELRIVLGYMNEYNVDKGAIIYNATYTQKTNNQHKPIPINDKNKYVAIIPLNFRKINKIKELDQLINEHINIAEENIIEKIKQA